MTHPSSPPAPMTAERLEEIREIVKRRDSLATDTDKRVGYPGARESEMLIHIDALTARVAELERDLATVMSDYSQIIAKQDDEIEAAEARAQAAEAKLETLRKVFAPMFKQFGPEWPDGEGLEVVLSHPDDEDGEEGVGACHFTLGQLRRALQTKDTTP